MFHKFNSKIFGVALIPFYAYAIICIFVFVNSGFRFETFNPLAIVFITTGTVSAALCLAFPNKRLILLGVLILFVVGGIGIYIGLKANPMNFIELFLSACIIAFAFAMYELVSKRLEENK